MVKCGARMSLRANHSQSKGGSSHNAGRVKTKNIRRTVNQSGSEERLTPKLTLTYPFNFVLKRLIQVMSSVIINNCFELYRKSYWVCFGNKTMINRWSSLVCNCIILFCHSLPEDVFFHPGEFDSYFLRELPSVSLRIDHTTDQQSKEKWIRLPLYLSSYN